MQIKKVREAAHILLVHCKYKQVYIINQTKVQFFCNRKEASAKIFGVCVFRYVFRVIYAVRRENLYLRDFELITIIWENHNYDFGK